MREGKDECGGAVLREGGIAGWVASSRFMALAAIETTLPLPSAGSTIPGARGGTQRISHSPWPFSSTCRCDSSFSGGLSWRCRRSPINLGVSYCHSPAMRRTARMDHSRRVSSIEPYSKKFCPLPIYQRSLQRNFVHLVH